MTITLRAGVLNSGIQQNGTEFLTVDTSNTVSLSAALPVLSGGTGVTTKTGTGAVVLGTAPTITGATITVAATAAPAFSAYLSTATQSIVAATWTKVILNSENFDTNNNFDSTTNYRFTPTVAGYYQFNCQIFAGSGSNTTVQGSIYKNGVAYSRFLCYSTSASLDDWSIQESALISLNGSTDYIELYALCVGSSILNGGATLETFMSGFLARSA